MGITRRISVILASVLVCLSVVGLAYASAQAEIQIVGQEQEGVINLESPEVTLFSNATFNQTLTDNTYLRLDGTNDPVGTSQVIFQSGNGRIVSTNGAGAISVQTSTGTAGAISFGNTADIGISSDGTVSGYDYDGTLVTKQKASNPDGEVEFLWLEEAGSWRYAIPGSGADLATGNPRSMIIGYGAKNNASDVYCSHNGFDMIDCNTGATGGDLGVADDLQVLGQIYSEDINVTGTSIFNAHPTIGTFTLFNPAGVSVDLNFNGTGGQGWKIGPTSADNFAFRRDKGNTEVFRLNSNAPASSFIIWGTRIDFNDGGDDLDFNIEPRSIRDTRRPFSYDANLNWIRLFDNLFSVNGTDNSTSFQGTVNYVDIDMSELPYGYEQSWWNATYIPTGMFLMNGSNLDRTNYAECFAIFGLQFGNTSETTFALPDLRGRNIIYRNETGTFDTVNATGGEETHTLTIGQLASHGHDYDYPAQRTFQSGTSAGKHGTADVFPGKTTSSVGSNQAHNVLDPYIVAGGKIVRC